MPSSRSGSGVCVFPYAVAKDVENFRGGEITVRFEGLSGRIDQGAGILFNLKPNGDYLALRANCLENNLVLWKFEKGKRSSVSWVRNAPAPASNGTTLRFGFPAPKWKLSRRQALSIAHAFRTRIRPDRSVVGKRTATCTLWTTP